MHAAVRPALRSASRLIAPARLIHGRRYPTVNRIRSFHSSPYRAERSTPPSTPEPASIDQNDPAKNADEKAAAAEQPEPAPATDDPEVLARKLQRSREMVRRYNSALKRSQRRNRTSDLPPVHVPTWFLQSSVQLREDAPIDARSLRGQTLSLVAKDKNSDQQSAVTISFWDFAKGLHSLSELVKLIGKKELRHLTDGSRDTPGIALLRHLSEEDGDRLRKVLGANLDSIDASLEKLNNDPEALDNDPRLRELRQHLFMNQKVSPLVLVEIRAFIRASLSLVSPDVNAPFPAAKSNLILHTPAKDADKHLHRIVASMGCEMGADIIRIDALDLAQIGGDYLADGSDLMPDSIRALGYETYKAEQELPEEEEVTEDDMFPGDQDAPADSASPPHSFGSMFPGPSMFPRPRMASLGIVVDGKARSSILKALGLGGNAGKDDDVQESTASPARIQSQGEAHLEDMKISALLEALIDSSNTKRARVPHHSVDASSQSSETTGSSIEKKSLDFFDYSMSNRAEIDISATLPDQATSRTILTVNVGPSLAEAKLPANSKIIHIVDIKEINATQYGARILQRLEEIVRRRRGEGENIMIIGTTDSIDLAPEVSTAGVRSLQSEGDSGLFRTIVVPVSPQRRATPEMDQAMELERIREDTIGKISVSEYTGRKFQSINVRHIEDMLRCLDPTASGDSMARPPLGEPTRSFMSLCPRSYFHRVLTFDEIHRIAITALGLHQSHASGTHVTWAHVAFAMSLLKASDGAKFAWAEKIGLGVGGLKGAEQEKRRRAHLEELRRQNRGYRMMMDRMRGLPGRKPGPEEEIGQFDGSNDRSRGKLDLNTVAATASKHEKKLLPGVVNPDRMKTTFDQVHVPKETIEAIRSLTTLSLLRPDAFNYGVLATERISGALLYGPPGTGKTLLAKAVAKESGATVLQVSGSEINDKYVGEGEKNVAAMFSLARKLSPCIVFLDEADAMFGSRDGDRQRVSHREILNQFLKEWDGMNDHSVFIMVATNRPFDLDDAVIRRLPRRLLVDLPTQEDRKAILKIHLRDEQLDESVDIDELAKRTPLYSGSDLKNIAVAAALACVREENEQAALAAVQKDSELGQPSTTVPDSATDANASESQSPSPSTSSFSDSPASNTSEPPTLKQGQTYTFPDKRVLHWRHFERAMQEISASISENMSSLNAIKKFDEQYGDRKGRRKKNAYGFGMVAESNESAARVRT